MVNRIVRKFVLSEKLIDMSKCLYNKHCVIVRDKMPLSLLTNKQLQ